MVRWFNRNGKVLSVSVQNHYKITSLKIQSPHCHLSHVASVQCVELSDAKWKCGQVFGTWQSRYHFVFSNILELKTVIIENFIVFREMIWKNIWLVLLECLIYVSADKNITNWYIDHLKVFICVPQWGSGVNFPFLGIVMYLHQFLSQL